MRIYIHLALLLASAIALQACSASDEPPTSSAEMTSKRKTKRTLTTAAAMGTPPENLVIDPTFASVNELAGRGVSTSDVTAHVDVPATSPAGPAQRVLVVQSTGGSPFIMMTAQAGFGAFEARVFVAVREGEPDPSIAVTTDGGRAHSLWPVEGEAAEQHGALTYRLFRGHVSDGMLGTVRLVIEPRGDGPVTIAAPRLFPSSGMNASVSASGTIDLPAAVKDGIARLAKALPPVSPLAGGRPSALPHAK